MNQTFDFQRFILTLKLEVTTKGKNYLLMGSLLFSLLLLMILPIVLSSDHSEMLMALHAMALFMIIMFGGSLYTSSVFSQYGSADTGIAALMLPASQVEKFLSSLLINLIFLIPFTAFFIKFHYWSIDYANAQPHSATDKYGPIPPDILRYFIYVHMIIQGSILLGSIYFKKQAYIKSAGALFIMSILFTLVYLGEATLSTGKVSKIVAFPFGSWKVWYFESNQYYHLVPSAQTIQLLYLFPIVFLLSMWYISFVRLQEKEI